MDDQRTDRTGGGIRYRKLRIAWSVAWGIVAVLLIALWVRSYDTCDLISSGAYRAPKLGIISMEGRLVLFGRYEKPPLRLLSLPVERVSVDKDSFVSDHAVFHIPRPRFGATYGLLIALVVPLGIASWVQWSWAFNVRTLLIGASLIAVVSGAIAYATK